MKWNARVLAFACAAALALAAGDATPQPAPSSSSASGATNDHAADLEAAIRAALNDHALQGANVGIAIYDIETGHYLATSNEHAPVNPASNAKLFTAAAALATL